MISVPVPFRLITTAALSLSAVLTGLYRPLVAANERQRVARPKEGRSVCCCGTTDGRCCGMACCQTPKQDENRPASTSRSDDRGQPIGFTLAAAGQPKGSLIGGLNTFTFADAIASDNLSVSLIGLSIRLNI